MTQKIEKIDLCKIYAEHCSMYVRDIPDKEWQKAYRAHTFGVYDALRSVAAKLGDEEQYKLLEELQTAIVGEVL